MRFGVLGPLAVWTADGRPVGVPGAKVRALLADLILHEGRPVSADRLAEDLWPADPPRNPAGALQAKVSQLRRALDDAEPGARRLIVTRAPGYLLRAGDDGVDAARFAALAERARAAGDPAVRAALLADALALWRGTALADFADEPFARAAVTRLEELRLTALEDRAEARLALGEDAALVAELGELVARHPLRERLRAAQMRALYRAGRPSEALRSYRELRDGLADELGIDPGPRLVALHLAILNQDPALDAGAVPGPATAMTSAGTGPGSAAPSSGAAPGPATVTAGAGTAPGPAASAGATPASTTLTGSAGAEPGSAASAGAMPGSATAAASAGTAPGSATPTGSDGAATGAAGAAAGPSRPGSTGGHGTAEGAASGTARLLDGPSSPATGADAEPATVAAGPRTNLPAPLTGLVGREEAVPRVAALLGASRLVTLTGPGGVGKTRLALEAAVRLAGSFPDGTWLVELAHDGRTGAAACADAAGTPGSPETADSADAIARTAAAVLGVRDDAAAGPVAADLPGPPAPPAVRLADALRPRRTLLLLDGCEHVVDAVADLAATLLHAAPGLRILATSREPLGVPGERLWPVPPLSVPDPSAAPDPAALRSFGAVRLFEERAAAADPGFAVDAGDADAVAAVCRRLDGLPLALELAATRVRALGVHGLLAGLDDRFRLLATGGRGVPARQRTLRAVIDWSWDTLTAPEAALLRRLTVPADGCDLSAAEAVGAGDPVAPGDVPGLLARLVDRSLVVAAGSGRHRRYRLLESVAAYGAERLREAGEAEPVRRRHHRHYAELAEEGERRLYGPGQGEWMERLDREAGNLRAALDGAARDGAAGLALRLVNALAWYWILRGRLGEARRSLETALGAAGDAPPAVRMRARAWRAGVALLEGRAGAAGDVRAVLAAYEEVADPAGRARARWFLGYACYVTGAPAAGEELVDGALAGLRAVGDRWGEAAALAVRARAALLRGDLAAAGRDGERGAALFGRLGDAWGVLQTVYPRASLAEVRGDYARAAELHRAGLRTAEDLRLWREACERLCGLGRIALLTGDHAGARSLHERARRLAAEQGLRAGEIHAEIGLGLGARREGRLDAAEEHLRAVLDWHRRAGFAPGTALLLAELGFVAEQRGDLDAARALHLEGHAAASATGDPRAVALAIEGLAGVEALAARHERAAVLLGAAAAARESAGAPLPPGERGDVDRITAAARAALGERAFAAAVSRGRAMGPEEACAPATS